MNVLEPIRPGSSHTWANYFLTVDLSNKLINGLLPLSKRSLVLKSSFNASQQIDMRKYLGVPLAASIIDNRSRARAVSYLSLAFSIALIFA